MSLVLETRIASILLEKHVPIDTCGRLTLSSGLARVLTSQGHVLVLLDGMTTKLSVPDTGIQSRRDMCIGVWL